MEFLTKATANTNNTTASGADFNLYDGVVTNITAWPTWFYLCFIGVVFLGLQILAWIVPALFGKWDMIPFVKLNHLDQLESVDRRNIFINKCLTALFVHNVIYVLAGNFSYLPMNNFAVGIGEITFLNFFGAIACFYIFYDFWYTNFHRFLHLGFVYPYIHKHHHRQKAPSRGNIDAINVHPFEFFVGEYNHLFSVYVIHNFVFPCHIASVVVFILLGGILASLNHTRFNVVVKAFTNVVYAVSAHDVHHTHFNYNYGQYTMLWDWVFGTYRHYDSIHPAKTDSSSSSHSDLLPSDLQVIEDTSSSKTSNKNQDDINFPTSAAADEIDVLKTSKSSSSAVKGKTNASPAKRRVGRPAAVKK